MSAGGYGELSPAIRALKYEGRRGLCGPLGRAMAEVLSSFLRGERGRGWEGAVLVPVPTWRRRAWERGFDQARLLAREVGRALGLPVVELLRRRGFSGRPQVGLGALERASNVEGVFEVIGQVEFPCVLLVDDVVTTGSTLRASAGALWGARPGLRVGALVACVEERGGEGVGASKLHDMREGLPLRRG